MRENLLHNFCAKKHLDEQAKKRYTICRPDGPVHKSPSYDTIQETRSMSDEIKNPNTEEDQPDLMTLEDEDGNEVTFEVIDALDHKGVHYLAVVEYTENEEDAEDAQLVILSVGEDDEGEYLDVVEDDETLLEVSKLFEQRLSDDYEID
jgi:uncharacterized protein YrzB (UPF0473 family)